MIVPRLLLLIAALVIGLHIIGSQSRAEREAAGSSSGPAQQSRLARFTTAKLFNFSSFKRNFNKNYGSLVEEMRREKIYLTNWLKSTASMFSFSKRRSSSFKRVNQMADWTPAEWHNTSISSDLYYERLLQHDKELNEATESNESLHSQDLAHEFEGTEDDEIKQVLEEMQMNRTADSIFKRKFDSFKRFLYREIVATTSSLTTDLSRGFTRTKTYPRRPELPDQLFHDHRACLSPVRNQGRCASCYIFSTISLFEWAFCRQSGEIIEFSEQYLLDCRNRTQLNGCGGGHELDIVGFVHDYGFETRAIYPFNGTEHECPYDSPSKLPQEFMGFSRMSKPTLKALAHKQFDEQLQRSPVLVAFLVNDDFFLYGGGVDRPTNCTGKKKGRMHAMLLVGAGREDGYEYWLIRNSHSDSWGEDGYFKLDKNSKCLVSIGYTLEVARPNMFLLKRNPNQLLPYKFSENPRYSWKLLATKFKTMLRPHLKSRPVNTTLSHLIQSTSA